MAYEVTATRKRPQKFEDLAGQEFVVSTLSNSIMNGRIAHAYLFSGPRGVGKTSAARILARSLNCEQGPTVSPCGTCPSCTEISRGSSMDVIEIDGASNTGVNDIREIKDEVLFAPNSSRYKVYIIDEVHMLSNSAFNALLKTIEEPPPYIIFIFATTEIHKVPATIRSRCQQFNFRLIGLERVKELLTEICQETSIEYEEDALLWVAKEGTGSLRDSYTLFDQVASFSDGNITLEKIREKLGLVGMEQINELIRIALSGDVSGVMEMTDSILSSGVSVDQFLVELAEYFRNLLFLKSGIDRQSIIGYEADKFDHEIIESFSEDQLLHGQDLIFTLYREIRYSLNERFELELLLNRLVLLRDHLSNRQILGRVERLKEDLRISHISDENTEVLVEDDKKKSPEVVPPQEAPPNDEAAEAFFRKFTSSASKQSESPRNVHIQNPDATHQKKENPFRNLGEKTSETKETASSTISIEGTTAVAAPVNPDSDKAVSMEAKVPAPSSAREELDLWGQLLLRLRADGNMQLFSLLERCDSHRLTDNQLSLKLNQAFDAHSLEEEERKLTQLLKELSGRVYLLKVDLVEAKEEHSSEEIDGQVELVRRIFQGQIVKQGGSR